VRLSRQNRFQMLFQFPKAAGNARQDVVQREEMDRVQKLAIIMPSFATPRLHH
jgi:hypothetical protein